jgi:hypothetical protein
MTWGGMDWTNRAQRVHRRKAIAIASQLASSQKGLSPIKLVTNLFTGKILR